MTTPSLPISKRTRGLKTIAPMSALLLRLRMALAARYWSLEAGTAGYSSQFGYFKLGSNSKISTWWTVRAGLVEHGVSDSNVEHIRIGLGMGNDVFVATANCQKIGIATLA